MKTLPFLIISLFIFLSLAYDTTIMSICVGPGSTNCRTYYGSTCIACNIGYTLNPNSKLNPCVLNTCPFANCDGCNSAGSICLKCHDPYSIFIQPENTCTQSCPLSNCAKCIAGSTSCTTCNSGYAKYSLTNKCISSPITNCQVIHDFANKQFQCTQCKPGYKPSKDQSLCYSTAGCSTIMDCQVCSGSTCTQCRAGYGLVAGSCQPYACIVNNCLYCNSEGVCQQCNSAFTLFGGQCVKKQCQLPNCQTCKPESIFCDSCVQGYTLNIWTKNCDLIPETPTNNLVYLWLLTIPVVIIIAIVIVCVYKKLKTKELAVPIANASKEQTSTISNEKFLESRQPLESIITNQQQLDSDPNKKNVIYLPPLEVKQQFA